MTKFVLLRLRVSLLNVDTNCWYTFCSSTFISFSRRSVKFCEPLQGFKDSSSINQSNLIFWCSAKQAAIYK